MHRKLVSLILAAALSCMSLACRAEAPASMPTSSASPPSVAVNGLSLTSWQPLQDRPRLWDAVVSTAALSEPVHVAVYLPADYDSQPGKRYPVLYLLHGHADSLDHALPWIVKGNATAIVDASPFKGIVVIPQCGKACWFVDWLKPTYGGYKPQWETYHVKQLVPWIDANFRTQGTRESRAIAGLSMGGFGALSMAGRFPDVFGQVGSFSGVPNIQDITVQQVVIANTVTWLTGAAYVSAENGHAWMARDVQDVFGAYSSDGWRSHNPYVMAPVYGQQKVQMALYAGGGSGPGGLDLLETAVGPYNDKFHAELNAKGVPHRYCRGANGKHAYPFWQADLADFLGVIAGQPPAACPNGWGAPKP